MHDKSKEENLLQELEAARARIAELEKAATESEERFQALFNKMTEGFALHEIICDEKGEPSDYRFLEINPAFELLTGLKQSDVVGKTAREVLPEIEPYWINNFGAVALTGRPVRFERYAPSLKRHYEVLAYCPAPRQFAVIFTDITERKRAEEALRQSEELARRQAEEIESIYNSAHIGLCVFDRNLRYVRINERLAEINGLPASEHIGKTLGEIVPDLAPLAEELAERIFRTGNPIFDVRFTGTTASQTGMQRHWIEHWLPLKRATGEIFGISVVVHDDTNHKKAEEALRKSEELARRRAEELQKLMDAAPVSIWVSNDPNCHHISGNPAGIRMYQAGEKDNLSAGPAPGKRDVTRRFFKHGTELLPEELPMQQAAAKGVDVRDIELDVRLPSGKMITMLGSASPLFNADGTVRGAIASYIDITERKQAEKALEKALAEAENEKHRLEAVMDALPMGVAILDEYGGSLNSNDAFDKIWRGASRKPRPPVHSLVDYPAYLAWWADTGKIVQPEEWASARAAQKGETVVGQVLEIRRFDGTHGFVINSAAPIRDSAGKVIGSTVAIQDITELRRAQDALRESETRYRELSKSLKKTVKEQVEQLREAENLASIGRMVAIVAHEIRNPLLNIQLGVDSLRGILSNNRALEIFEEIEHGAELLNDTLTELLEYARAIRLERKVKPIGEIIDQALKGASQTLTGITVDLELKNEKTEISVDAPKMTRVFTNILTNAAEAMPEGGRLKIQSKLSSPRRLSIAIRDSGHGMDARDMANLFQPFYTTKINGTGLGLAIAKKIVEAHGGRISIKSKPGKGATVTISLPISPQTPKGNPQ